jgi:hypothetical protein
MLWVPRALGSAGADVSAPPEYAYVLNVRSVTLQRTGTSVALEMSFPWERISNKMWAFCDTQLNLNIIAKEGTEVRKGTGEWNTWINASIRVSTSKWSPSGVSISNKQHLAGSLLDSFYSSDSRLLVMRRRVSEFQTFRRYEFFDSFYSSDSRLLVMRRRVSEFQTFRKYEFFAPSFKCKTSRFRLWPWTVCCCTKTSSSFTDW